MLTGKPTITVGSVGLSNEFLAALHKGEDSPVEGIEALVARLERDEFDLVGVGRALITDPAWVKKIRERRLDELLPFNSKDLSTLY